ncbi:MAG: hypothetical protein N2053_06220, partial [Chitinispirillaceae bacterium]|nr:hypothetical protein [Chitinispirillaceae bacterium]
MNGKRLIYIKGMLEIILIINFCFANSDTLINRVVDSASIDTLQNIKAISSQNATVSSKPVDNFKDEENIKKTKRRVVKHTFDYRQQIVLS